MHEGDGDAQRHAHDGVHSFIAHLQTFDGDANTLVMSARAIHLPQLNK